MPASPSISVMALRVAAVCGERRVVEPDVPGRSFFHSVAATPPWSIGISIDSPVRLSVIVTVSATSCLLSVASDDRRWTSGDVRVPTSGPRRPTGGCARDLDAGVSRALGRHAVRRSDVVHAPGPARRAGRARRRRGRPSRWRRSVIGMATPAPGRHHRGVAVAGRTAGPKPAEGERGQQRMPSTSACGRRCTPRAGGRLRRGRRGTPVPRGSSSSAVAVEVGQRDLGPRDGQRVVGRGDEDPLLLEEELDARSGSATGRLTTARSSVPVDELGEERGGGGVDDHQVDPGWRAPHGRRAGGHQPAPDGADHPEAHRARRPRRAGRPRRHRAASSSAWIRRARATTASPSSVRRRCPVDQRDARAPARAGRRGWTRWTARCGGPGRRPRTTRGRRRRGGRRAGGGPSRTRW